MAPLNQRAFAGPVDEPSIAARNAPYADGEPRIRGEGTPEASWQHCAWLWQRAATPLRQLLGKARRLLVIAPHPDDEVLACGGLMALAAEAGLAVEVIAVTDGEACYPDEPWWTPERLVHARRQELAQALATLGMDAVTVHHLGVGDGTVERHESRLAYLLRPLISEGDLVLAPWHRDGHPDHDAASRAASAVAGQAGARLLEYPVWAWHWLQPGQLPGVWPRPVLLDIATVVAVKQQAIACFATQTGAVDKLGAVPILPPHVLQRFARSTEVYLA